MQEFLFKASPYYVQIQLKPVYAQLTTVYVQLTTVTAKTCLRTVNDCLHTAKTCLRTVNDCLHAAKTYQCSYSCKTNMLIYLKQLMTVKICKVTC